MPRMEKDLFLVGSLPLETEEEVFRLCGGTVADLVPCLPDGEVGERVWWVTFLAHRVYHPHPDIETLRRPSPKDWDPEGWMQTSYDDIWQLTVKPGVEKLEFGELGYARAAIRSYGIFGRLREEGVVPRDVRFQVDLPLTASALHPFFWDPADYPIVEPAFEAACRREIEQILEHIPADDLVIMWDACVELLDVEGWFPYTPQDNRVERNLACISGLVSHIPEDVWVGYHWCYGTLGGWPMMKYEDLGVCVELSNDAVGRSGRRIDFVHMPALRKRTDEAFYAPLRNLDIGDAKVYLGLIHHTEGTDTEMFRKRLAAARAHLSDFGIASVCGYGRVEHDVREVLEVHRADALAMQES